jgi:hypothetical protein
VATGEDPVGGCTTFTAMVNGENNTAGALGLPVTIDCVPQ